MLCCLSRSKTSKKLLTTEPHHFMLSMKPTRLLGKVIIVIGAILFISSPTLVHAQTIISDSTFNAIDWSATVVFTSGSASHTFQQVASGGNPGAFREMTHTVTSSSEIIVAHLFLASSYNPSISGAIGSLDYREDRVEFFPPFSGAAIGATPVLFQGNVFYFGPDITFANLTWQTRQLPGLTVNDFVSGVSTHPDFSSNGGDIQFGYLRSNTSNAGASFTTQHGIDNWSYAIHTVAVPEPNSLIMLTGVCVLSSLAFRRRRRTIRDSAP